MVKGYGFWLLIWQREKSERLGSDVPPNFHEESVNELTEPGNEVIDFNQAKGAQETRSKAEKQSRALLCDTERRYTRLQTREQNKKHRKRSLFHYGMKCNTLYTL